MKRILSRALPHLTIILGLMTLVFYVVDGFNAVMAFMASELSKQVFMVLAVCAIISSVMLISRQWKEDDRKARKAARLIEESTSVATEDVDPFEDDDDDFTFSLDEKTDKYFRRKITAARYQEGCRSATLLRYLFLIGSYFPIACFSASKRSNRSQGRSRSCLPK